MRFPIFWNVTVVGDLGRGPSAEHYVCVCVCLCVVRSASVHCISSSGQGFNLCDPARDYGGSGRKKRDLKLTLGA